MLRWVLDNREWLFSGVGLVVILGLWRLVSWYRKRKNLAATSTQEQSFAAVIEGPPVKAPEIIKDTKIGSLSPDAIMTSIHEAPLLQRPDVVKHYIGVPVTWEGVLTNARKKDPNLIHLLIRVGKGNYSVFADIIPSQYSGLGLLKYGHPIRVSGTISEISIYIILSNARIEFELSSPNKKLKVY